MLWGLAEGESCVTVQLLVLQHRTALQTCCACGVCKLCSFLYLKFLQGDLVAVGVLSGNRNFEGRVHPNTRANYLASPPLVIAYAIAGTIRIDFEKEPLGKTLLGCL